MHPLDNAIWEALGTHHAEFAQQSGDARRYHPEVSSLCSVRDDTDPACWDDLAPLVPPRSRAGVLLWRVPGVGDHLRIHMTVPLVQMTRDPGLAVPASAVDVPHRRLTVDDAPQMLELVRLTHPGPMTRRTVDLGLYLGIFDDDARLIAMAGERCRLPGWTEVSAICTHPGHRGRGLARHLMLLVMQGIVARGEVPFLHVAESNAGAQHLYHTLGFSIRRVGEYVMLERASGGSA